LLNVSLLEIINKCVGIDEVLKGFMGEIKGAIMRERIKIVADWIELMRGTQDKADWVELKKTVQCAYRRLGSTIVVVAMMVVMMADLEPRYPENHDGKAESKLEGAVAKRVAESADHDVRKADAGPGVKWRLSGRRFSIIGLARMQRHVWILAE